MSHFLSLEIILGTVTEGVWSCTCCSISPVDLSFCRCSTRELWRSLILAPWASTWSVSTLTYVRWNREFTQHWTYPASSHAVTPSFHRNLFCVTSYQLRSMTGARTNVTIQHSLNLLHMFLQQLRGSRRVIKYMSDIKKICKEQLGTLYSNAETKVQL